MAYFPKLLSGPIERARTFLPKLAAQRIVDNDVLARSFALIVIGVVRKVVFADTLFTMLPARLWKEPERFSSPELIVYLIVYAFALYNDFAGYTGVVRGVSGLFGIELAPNFNIPYFSRNLSEFWNRWHITLSQWLRDYIYFPTSRALLRRNPSLTNVPNIFLPPLLTMLASGLWHGTGWGMLLWGALHGVYLIVERLLSLWRPAGPPHLQPRWRQGLATTLVFVLVMLAWVPFRASELSDHAGLLAGDGQSIRPGFAHRAHSDYSDSGVVGGLGTISQPQRVSLFALAATGPGDPVGAGDPGRVPDVAGGYGRAVCVSGVLVVSSEF